MALTDTIYEKVRSSFFPAAIRFQLKALKTEKGRSIVRLDQVRRMNLYLICAWKGQRPLNCSSAMQWCWFRFDKGRMPGQRSSTIGSRRVRFGSRARTINRRCTILAATYVFLDLTNLSN
ncbi:hypothetical protein M9H77_23611 [Catharanthus roseus]|uniref:Uncharacterized protein n=1 Tax=Catharanthus roseus TaxID=4058 RepID=A0ACC0ATI2_CATRO|nr:hypothetical protein M9H77_23611 [Catharanthus roseus]